MRTARPLKSLLLQVALALVFTFAVAPVALASDDARLGLGLKSVVSGKELPAITLAPGEAVKALTVKLERGDGKRLTLKAAGLPAGRPKVLPIDQPNGVFAYRAEFHVVWGDKSTSTFTTEFKATRVGKLELRIGAGDVDLEGRRLTFQITNPAASAELVILGERGRELGIVRESWEDAPPGTPLELTWDAVEGDIVRMDLKVTDVAGFWAGMQITPFSIEIPHDEVVFESGQAAVRDSEAPKLQRTMAHIQEALARHGTLLQLKLFVAGYTDTVGGRASNQELSTRRAAAIAGWFRKNGLKIPIYYQGFGEDALAKPTPDETEEPANRRALYILSSQQPGTSASVPRGDWRKL